ncbi:MAG: hypothetical protein ACFFAS_01100 [Promethearchaeota archaeon]
MTTIIEQVRNVAITCPICKYKKKLNIPESIVKKTNQLTTVSLPRGIVCDHHFQMFIDRNFKIRGYQKVDFELATPKNDKNIKDSDKHLFTTLLYDGNYIEYRPLNQFREIKNNNNKILASSKKKKTLKEIYDDFWEFIDDDNKKFERFIKTDKRRNNANIFIKNGVI